MSIKSYFINTVSHTFDQLHLICENIGTNGTSTRFYTMKMLNDIPSLGFGVLSFICRRTLPLRRSTSDESAAVVIFVDLHGLPVSCPRTSEPLAFSFDPVAPLPGFGRLQAIDLDISFEQFTGTFKGLKGIRKCLNRKKLLFTRTHTCVNHRYHEFFLYVKYILFRKISQFLNSRISNQKLR